MTTAIWWVRRDIRLADNQTLTAALQYANQQVVPVFIFDPVLWNSPYVGEKRVAFLLASLRQLDADLQARGSRLIIRRGDPKIELTRLLSETQANAIFAEADFSPYARRRDKKIAVALPLRLNAGVTVHHPDTVLKADGTPYTVFTPFSRTWKSLPLPQSGDVLPAPDTISTPASLHSETIPVEPSLSLTIPFPASETEAQHRLAGFLDRLVFDYGGQRNRMDLHGTSMLSPYLRFGLLSARQAVVVAREAIENASIKEARKGAETWLNELIWREFYTYILYHFPQVRQCSFRSEYDYVDWNNDEQAFAAWTEGRTGYPVVDAAMRQLRHCGWMHNRARMIVASFLVKDLLIDWRWGERWFMQHLIDGDPAANNGGWQWIAGTGTDAAPYFRVFNPILQGQKFDPEGDYIRRWMPALADVPTKYIHQPWKMPSAMQRELGCVIGQDYTAPIVDHREARERALTMYTAAKELAVAKELAI